MQKKGTGQNAKRGGKVAQKKVRQLVIDFLKMKKGTQKQVAELFGLGLNGVQRIWKRYKEKGYRGLTSKKHGVQGGKKINGKLATDVRQLIKYKLPDQMKLSFGLWTSGCTAIDTKQVLY